MVNQVQSVIKKVEKLGLQSEIKFYKPRGFGWTLSGLNIRKYKEMYTPFLLQVFRDKLREIISEQDMVVSPR